ncbi:hypothetical protein Tco_1037000 [Tanacetum coccineum]
MTSSSSGNRLISWQCKKQTVVATSTTEAEYVAAASCCGQVLWIQNQLLDYGYNFMNTVIYIDNNSTICIIENPVQHSKTKHIEIRHHFIRDCNAKKLIQMAKIDSEHNVADLLTKGFDAGRFQYLVSTFLEKSTGSEGFHQVIDFLSQSHISYALTKKPEIYISFIKQFWRTAEASTDTDGEVTITAIIDGQSKTITEASLRRHLKLEDHDGITSIPNSKIFEQLALMGYQTDSDNPKKTAWEAFKYHVPTPNESPLHVVHSHGSDEGSLKLNELTNLVTKLSERIGVLEDDLKKTKQTYSSAFTKLILRIKKLESKVKTGKARKRARVVLSEDEEDDSSKQGRINEDPNTYFAQDDEVVHDQDTAAERQLEDSTAGITVSTAPINISTARESPSTAGRVVYGRRSKEARKDKGKEIMTEPEPVKKSKKLLEQERQGLEEAIRLQKQVDEEEKAQIARDEEIARQLLALDEERVTTDPKTTKDIDWNDPSVQKYWNIKNKPKDLGIEKEKKKPAEFQVEQIEKDTTGKRKKSLPRKGTRSTTKRQKVELDDEKEDLKGYLDIVPREDVATDVDSLSTKYPIVDWKTYTC